MDVINDHSLCYVFGDEAEPAEGVKREMPIAQLLPPRRLIQPTVARCLFGAMVGRCAASTCRACTCVLVIH